MLTSKKLWLGVLVSAVFLVLFLYGIDFPDTGAALKSANYLYVIPAVAVYFGSLVFRALRWQYILRNLRLIPLRRLYAATVVGYMANNVLPVRLGEVAKAYYLGQREKVSATSTLATVGIERIYDGITLMFVLLVIWPFLPLGELFKNDSGDLMWVRAGIGALLVAVFFGAIVTFVAVAFRPELGRRLTDIIVFFVPGRFKGQVENLAELFIGGLESLNSPRKLLGIFVLSIPVWIMESLMYYLITFSFDLDVPFSLALAVTATSNLVGAIPAAPGNVGTFEWATKVTLVSFGHNAEASVAYAATLHLTLWLPVVIAGIIYMWTQHRSLMELAQIRPVAVGADGDPVGPVPLERKGEK